MSYKRLTILCDLDSIAANLMKDWFKLYNDEYHDDLNPDKIKSWDVHLYTKKECGTKIYHYLNSSLFRALNPIEGAVEGLYELHQAGHEIAFVTASPKNCADAKQDWVVEHFPFFTHRDVIIAHKKHLLKGDILIDDSPSNLRTYKYNNPDSKLFTIAYSYNECVKDLVDLRLGSWQDTRTAWTGFVKEIERISYIEAVREEELPETD